MAMIAMTTSSSISVNPRDCRAGREWRGFMEVVLQTVTSLFFRQQDRGNSDPDGGRTAKALRIERTAAGLGNDFLASRAGIPFSCPSGADAIGP
jgi:hypothetical protein